MHQLLASNDHRFSADNFESVEFCLGIPENWIGDCGGCSVEELDEPINVTKGDMSKMRKVGSNLTAQTVLR